MEYRSNCPISSLLDIMGDKWSFLIIRDIMFGKKRTFGEFSSSSEKMASNILSDRLSKLEEAGIIYKGKLPDNKKKNIYTLSPKGIELLPIIVEMILWSDRNLPDHIQEQMKNLAENIRRNKAEFIENYSKLLANQNQQNVKE